MLGNAGETELDLRFQLMGIPVRVHPAFWLTAAFVCWGATGGNPQLVLIGIVCVFFSIIIHEMGHALMFRRYGLRGEIVLYLMGGYATGGRLSTWRDIAVSAAGPGAGFVVAGTVWLLQESIPQETLMRNYHLGFCLYILWRINFWWGILNLTPCLPLDGGQIMEALIHRYRPRQADLQVLWVSIISSGAVALWGAQNRHRFLMIFFGLMCVQHVIALNHRNSFR